MVLLTVAKVVAVVVGVVMPRHSQAVEIAALWYDVRAAGMVQLGDGVEVVLKLVLEVWKVVVEVVFPRFSMSLLLKKLAGRHVVTVVVLSSKSDAIQNSERTLSRTYVVELTVTAAAVTVLVPVIVL